MTWLQLWKHKEKEEFRGGLSFVEKLADWWRLARPRLRWDDKLIDVQIVLDNDCNYGYYPPEEEVKEATSLPPMFPLFKEKVDQGRMIQLLYDEITKNSRRKPRIENLTYDSIYWYGGRNWASLVRPFVNVSHICIKPPVIKGGFDVDHYKAKGMIIGDSEKFL